MRPMIKCPIPCFKLNFVVRRDKRSIEISRATCQLGFDFVRFKSETDGKTPVFVHAEYACWESAIVNDLVKYDGQSGHLKIFFRVDFVFDECETNKNRKKRKKNLKLRCHFLFILSFVFVFHIATNIYHCWRTKLVWKDKRKKKTEFFINNNSTMFRSRSIRLNCTPTQNRSNIKHQEFFISFFDFSFLHCRSFKRSIKSNKFSRQQRKPSNS